MAKIIVTAAAIGLMATASAMFLSRSVESPNPPQAASLAADQRTAEPAAQTSGGRIVALRADPRGHFVSDIQINGQYVRALVDTGASIVAFSAEDARKANLVPPASAYTLTMNTANGQVRAARMLVPELRLQSIVLRNVEAVVMPQGALHVTLLGMSFLRRLQGFEINGGALTLRQ